MSFSYSCMHSTEEYLVAAVCFGSNKALQGYSHNSCKLLIALECYKMAFQIYPGKNLSPNAFSEQKIHHGPISTIRSNLLLPFYMYFENKRYYLLGDMGPLLGRLHFSVHSRTFIPRVWLHKLFSNMVWHHNLKGKGALKVCGCQWLNGNTKVRGSKTKKVRGFISKLYT